MTVEVSLIILVSCFALYIFVDFLDELIDLIKRMKDGD